MIQEDGEGGGLVTRWVAGYLGYILFFALAVWGGTASYINRIKKNKMPFSFVELVGEWSISGFAGVMTALICAEFGFSFYMTAAFAGIAGHMGGRAVYVIERMFTSRFNEK